MVETRRPERIEEQKQSQREGGARTAIIIGAGPAGLTAAFELLTRTDIVPIVLEKSTFMGGISRTVNYKGNRIDIGGHRFFSKSDRVMEWWLRQVPLQNTSGVMAADSAASSSTEPVVFLVRYRKSRIYFLRKFFEYPIQMNAETLRNLGFARVMRIGLSYLRTTLMPSRKAQNLEEFFIGRFGRELYKTFFESYTEKVWGMPCREISAEWGAQRIKGLSITRTLVHYIKQKFTPAADIRQKNVETSLIERFIYPALGPGQLWEQVAKRITELGGRIVTGVDVDGIHAEDDRIVSVWGRDGRGERKEYRGDYFFSTMPVRELVRALDSPVPESVREISNGLLYRDFITVGLLVNKLAIKDKHNPDAPITDNWIYIQEPDVVVARLQLFNNWSPFLVRDPQTVWMGAEYFCNEGDRLWNMPDSELARLAQQELAKIGIIDAADVRDATVIRMPKAYPAYFGTYDRFGAVRDYLSKFSNLFLVGRNGMHKYNNQDHSMLTAMTAVDNIIANRADKENIWAVNTEMEYHEEK